MQYVMVLYLRKLPWCQGHCKSILVIAALIVVPLKIGLDALKGIPFLEAARIYYKTWQFSDHITFY